MAENPLEGIGAKLKKNKLIVPAALVGGGIGLFFLLRGGGGGGSSSQYPVQGYPNQTPEESGSGGDFQSAINDLASQVESQLGSVTEQFSSVTSDLQQQITDQQKVSEATSASLVDYFNQSLSGVQDAINSVAGSYAPQEYSVAPEPSYVDYGYDPFSDFSQYDTMTPELEQSELSYTPLSDTPGQGALGTKSAESAYIAAGSPMLETTGAKNTQSGLSGRITTIAANITPVAQPAPAPKAPPAAPKPAEAPKAATKAAAKAAAPKAAAKRK